MIHNGSLKLGDFGSAGCASLAAATLASTLQKQALAAARKRQALAAAPDGQQPDLVDQQQLLVELEALQHNSSSQLHLQADCTAEAAVLQGNACEQQQHSHTMPARFGVAGDSVSGVLSPSVSGRLSVQAVKDAMNFRIGSIEYMAPEMLNKPTAAEVFHLVSAAGERRRVLQGSRGTRLVLEHHVSFWYICLPWTISIQGPAGSNRNTQGYGGCFRL
jgi:hypothetical protein